MVLGSLRIAACVPQVNPNDLSDTASKTARSRLPANVLPGPVFRVLPGNPLPEAGSARVDDFEDYPTGAVLPAANPRDYGFLRYGKEWNRVTVSETFGPDGRLGKSVRLERGVGEGLLTIGAGDWSDYAGASAGPGSARAPSPEPGSGSAGSSSAPHGYGKAA